MIFHTGTFNGDENPDEDIWVTIKPIKFVILNFSFLETNALICIYWLYRFLNSSANINLSIKNEKNTALWFFIRSYFK